MHATMKQLFLAAVFVLSSLAVQADEGMWPLPMIKGQLFQEMQALGLQLQAQDIYNPDSSSLKDAVVVFGGGCTGEMISPDGLLLTNHHCGYGCIQRHSTLEHDYLTDGFWAMSREEELPNPGMTVTFIDKIEDVTAFVKQELDKETDPNSMNFQSAKFLNKLARSKVGEKFLQDHPGTEVEIKPFYGGNQYYMFTKKIYSDVRLVGAPPSSIGKFGADTDNWMWPRHTGDFSIFRVYADRNGNPAPYSKENVPLHPKRWLKISLAGIQENDFAMMMGFPGGLSRCRHSHRGDCQTTEKPPFPQLDVERSPFERHRIYSNSHADRSAQPSTERERQNGKGEATATFRRGLPPFCQQQLRGRIGQANRQSDAQRISPVGCCRPAA